MSQQIDAAIDALFDRKDRESKVMCWCGHNQYRHDVDEDVCNECSPSRAIHLFRASAQEEGKP